MDTEIFGNKYSIGGDLDQARIRELSLYVDRKMKEIATNSDTISSMKIAVLAALNIAEDLFSLKEQYNSKVSKINKKIDILSNIIDNELNEKGR